MFLLWLCTKSPFWHLYVGEQGFWQWTLHYSKNMKFSWEMSTAVIFSVPLNQVESCWEGHIKRLLVWKSYISFWHEPALLASCFSVCRFWFALSQVNQIDFAFPSARLFASFVTSIMILSKEHSQPNTSHSSHRELFLLKPFRVTVDKRPLIFKTCMQYFHALYLKTVVVMLHFWVFFIAVSLLCWWFRMRVWLIVDSYRDVFEKQAQERKPPSHTPTRPLWWEERQPSPGTSQTCEGGFKAHIIK